MVLYQWIQRATCHSTSRRLVQAGPVRLIASVLNNPMVDSHSALSSASPMLPIEPAIPAVISSAVKATDTYWADSRGRRNTSNTEVADGTT